MKHSAAVRDIAVVEGLGFVSCSNDGTVIIWSTASSDGTFSADFYPIQVFIVFYLYMCVFLNPHITLSQYYL